MSDVGKLRADQLGCAGYQKPPAPKDVEDQSWPFSFLGKFCMVWRLKHIWEQVGLSSTLPYLKSFRSVDWGRGGGTSNWKSRHMCLTAMWAAKGMVHQAFGMAWFWNAVDLIASWQLSFPNYVWLSLVVKLLYSPYADPENLQRGQRGYCLKSRLGGGKGRVLAGFGNSHWIIHSPAQRQGLRIIPWPFVKSKNLMEHASLEYWSIKTDLCVCFQLFPKCSSRRDMTDILNWFYYKT